MRIPGPGVLTVAGRLGCLCNLEVVPSLVCLLLEKYIKKIKRVKLESGRNDLNIIIRLANQGIYWGHKHICYLSVSIERPDRTFRNAMSEMSKLN